MMHKAWRNMEEVPYCFSRSSIKFQGHTGQKNPRFPPELSVSALQLQFEFTEGFEMMHKTWCNVEEVPYDFSSSSMKFQGSIGWKIEDLNPIWVRLLDRSQLSNPSDLPPCSMSHGKKIVDFDPHCMRKITCLKSGWGFGQTNSPLSTARVLIDAAGLCLLRVSEVWRLFAPDLRRWINSFSGSDFKPRLVYKTLYFCYFFTNYDQQF